MKLHIGSLYFLLVLLLACGKDEDTPEEITLVYPSHFPAPHYQFEGNAFTKEGFELGRQLFFDPLLSLNNTVSCGSCHAQTHFFADHNVSVSTGVFGRQGIRNSPPIFNILWNTSFMWDGGVNHIELSGLPALTDTNEMAENLQNIINKLAATEKYPPLFEKAFGSSEITDQHIFFALTQFTGALISANSKYDQYILGKIDFTAEEESGLHIFRTHCETCHQEPLFTDYSFRNNGLDFVSADKGRGRITLETTDYGKFKVPTLRNVMHTYPYMHDGRFMNINQVLDHYHSGIQAHPNLDPLLQNGIPLTEEERYHLKKFLHTLTDESLLSNPLFYEPK